MSLEKTSDRKKQVEGLKRRSDWFLGMLAISVVVMGRENWAELDQDIETNHIAPSLIGLTHKDYVDGLVLQQLISHDEAVVKALVLKEGFNSGINRIRKVIADMFVPTIPISRGGVEGKKFEAIKRQRQEKNVVAVYMTGTKDLLADMKMGVSFFMQDDDKFYPFINLSDTKPVFPSDSTFEQKTTSVLQQTLLKNKLSKSLVLLARNVGKILERTTFNRQHSQEFLYLMKPLAGTDLVAMQSGKEHKLGRREQLNKLEVVRAFGVMKMLFEATDEQAEALCGNADNLPLFEKCYQILRDKTTEVRWLVDSGYFVQSEVDELFESLRLPGLVVKEDQHEQISN